MYKFIMVTLLFCSIATPALAGVVLDHGFVRAMPPGQKITAAYMSLTNTDAQDAVVSAVSSDMAARVEIHESYIVNLMIQAKNYTLSLTILASIFFEHHIHSYLKNNWCTRYTNKNYILRYNYAKVYSSNFEY